MRPKPNGASMHKPLLLVVGGPSRRTRMARCTCGWRGSQLAGVLAAMEEFRTHKLRAITVTPSANTRVQEVS